MNKAEWLNSTDTAGLERSLWKGPPPASERQWRLYACACVRHLWPRLPGIRLRRAFEVSERYADGRASWDDLRWANADVGRLISNAGGLMARKRADAARAVFTASALSYDEASTPLPLLGGARTPAEAATRLALLRDVFGHRIHRVRRDPNWDRWQGGVIPRLADDIYDGRHFGELPVLADALEDAGCAAAALLAHLRAPGPHDRGCWALDAVLGRE